MLTRTRACLLMASLSIAVGACGSSATTPSPSASSPPPPSAEATIAPTLAPVTTPEPTQQPDVSVYRVKKGDTLTSIAHRFKIKLAALIAANPQLPDPNKLKIGDRINIPKAASPSPSA